MMKNIFRVRQGSYADIETALEKSRELPGGILRIIELEGEYTLEKSINLDERDNGLTIRGGKLIGGIELNNWEQDPQDSRFVRAKLPNGVNPQAFIVNSHFRKNAMYPHNGFLECKNKPENLWWTGSIGGGWNRPLTDDELLHMDVNSEDIPNSFMPGSSKVKMYHIWDESTVTVAEFNCESGKMTFKSKPEHPAGAFKRVQYRLLNLRAGMSKPGVWYTDLSEGWIYYWPQSDETEHFKAFVPALENIINIKNADNVILSGIEMMLANTADVTSGLRSINFGGAVTVENSENIIINNLYVHNGAGHGIKVLKSKNYEINGCLIEDMGAGGIFTHECEDELICNNKIKSIGLSAYSSIGIHAGGKSMLVWVQDGKVPEKGQTVIRSNTIENVPYCGITCNGGPHIVEYNTAVNCMSELEDGGAIYLSRAKETIVRGNKLYGNYGGLMKKGVYYDEGGCGCLSVRNEFYGMETPYGDHLCYGMKIIRNHFENDDILRLHFADSIGYEIEKNVFVSNSDLHMNISLATFEKTVEKEVIEEALVKIHYRMNNNYFCTPSDEVIINK